MTYILSRTGANLEEILGLRHKRDQKKAAKAANFGLPDEILIDDPLEALLDEQSDEEFGELVLKDKEVVGKPVKLAEWTARDFSSVYLRFRPHLERHARRFLRNPSQVDEVVQDAFLYLMVSLPELDSEIGVLRFLKWKTRLLALDVIRASGKAYINSLDDIPEPESSDPEISDNLEQQDDAAVVKLALSKLNPRHREVLIASMYEEKSTEQIASQVGLTENATRQLIFRARAAFKKALIGDVDTSGMSAAGILSVAARKAAQESKKIGASAMALVALVVMSLAVWPMLGNPRAEQNTATSPGSIQPQPVPSQPQALSEGTDSSLEVEPEDSQPTAAEPSTDQEPQAPSLVTGPGSTELDLQAPKSAIEDVEAVAKILKSADSSTQFTVETDQYLAETANNVKASFVFRAGQSPTFSDVSFIFSLNGQEFFAKPVDGAEAEIVDKNGYIRFVYLGTIPFVFDVEGKTWRSSELTQATVKIEVRMTAQGDKAEQIMIKVTE